MHVEARLEALGLVLPAPIQLPPGVAIPFAWVRVRGNHAYVSGHSPLAADGSFVGPAGRIPDEVTPEQGYEAARGAALSVLASLKRALGDLDRVTAWLVVNGLVNTQPGYARSTTAINGFSDLILDLYGDEVGAHARTAIGVTALPLNSPVIVSAEVEIAV